MGLVSSVNKKDKITKRPEEVFQEFLKKAENMVRRVGPDNNGNVSKLGKPKELISVHWTFIEVGVKTVLPRVTGVKILLHILGQLRKKKFKSLFYYYHFNVQSIKCVFCVT